MIFATVTQSLAGLSLLATAVALALFLALVTSSGRSALRRSLAGNERHVVGWAGLVALIATGGSLYFSTGAGLLPCALCWWQRIAMYPLIVILGVGFARGDPDVWRYALPLPLAGLTVSAYHVLLQYRPNLHIVECATTAPCSLRYIAVFGFVSIPTMAGAAFFLIAVLLATVMVVRNLPSG